MEKCFYINYILVSVENFYNNKNEERRDNEEENGKKSICTIQDILKNWFKIRDWNVHKQFG